MPFFPFRIVSCIVTPEILTASAQRLARQFWSGKFPNLLVIFHAAGSPVFPEGLRHFPDMGQDGLHLFPEAVLMGLDDLPGSEGHHGLQVL